MHTNRRDFLRAVTAAGLIAPRLTAQTTDARVDIALDEPVGTIAPEIYGHFVENLGGVVYDGIWVGEKSKIPNVGGLRKELVDALRKVKPGAIRWPGGCFADQYDWRDGIGPRDKRPRRTNFWAGSEWPKGANPMGPQHYDPNEFGTIEFARFSRLCGAEPYFAANLRSLPAEQFWRWVEYANSPAHSTTLADQRTADGESSPLNVRFWGVGNESWGCGGNFDPEDYASEFKRYTAWVPSYGLNLALVGSGPSDGNIDWTERFFRKAAHGGLDHMWGWAMHHYSWNASGGRTQDWNAGKGDAVKFDPEQYYEILREADEMDSLIAAQWAVMAQHDPRHHVKLVVDEWGSWYAGGTEPFPEALIGQQNTMRDAVLAGLTLDTFNRQCDKVGMAAIAQLVNCLQSLFFAHEDKFCVTPTYHVFDMYAAHQGATAVRADFSAPAEHYTRNGKAASIRGLNGAASLNGKQLTVTVTNPSLERPCTAAIGIRGGSAKSAAGMVLSAADPHAHNSFENPRAVEPKEIDVKLSGGGIVHQFPPASVTKLIVTLG
jgi:alpha-N-arabinofuranosidase